VDLYLELRHALRPQRLVPRHGQLDREGPSNRDLECAERIEQVSHRGMQNRGWLRCLDDGTVDMR
jgi:hypothetical protein